LPLAVCLLPQHSRGLAEDTPAFRQRLHRKHVDAVDFEAKARKVVVTVEAYLKAMSGFGDLTACIEEVLPDATGNSSSGAAHDVIKLFGDLTEKMEALSKTVHGMVVEPINSYLDGDVAVAKTTYAQFLESQKRVEKSRVEYMKMTSDTGTEFLATKEKALGEDQFKLELQRFDALGKLDEVQQRTSGVDALFWQQYIQAFVSCQSDFYEQAAELTAKSSLAGTGGRQLQEKILKQEQALEVERLARVELRKELEVASPTISESDHTTLLEGWLHKQSFNISKAERSNLATRMAGYKKRWFVLRADGMMLYYKSQDTDEESCAMPVDLRQVSDVTDPDEMEQLRLFSEGKVEKAKQVKITLGFTFVFGGRPCGLKADSIDQKREWMQVMREWLDGHKKEQAEFKAKQEAKYAVKGTGVRDLDYEGGSKKGKAELKRGFLYRQEGNSNGKRWQGKKHWAEVGEDLTFKLWEIQVPSVSIESATAASAAADAGGAGSGGGGGGGSPGAGSTSVSGASSSARPGSEAAAGEGGAGASEGYGDPVVELPLMLATVKEEREALIRFCFRIITPHDSLLLQAGSLEDMNEFMDSVQHAISEGLNAQMSGGGGGGGGGSSGSGRGGGFGGGGGSAEDAEEQQRVMKQLRSKPGNDTCADCNCVDVDSVTWASVNLGVLLCLDCSGVHRSMGTHISKMRSAILDVKQWTPELLEVFAGVGNDVANSILEQPAELAKHNMIKPTTDSPRPDKERFIRAKYEQKLFIGSVDEALAVDDTSDATASEGAGEGAAAAAADAAAEGGRSESDRVGLSLMQACIKGDLPQALKLILLSTATATATAAADGAAAAAAAPRMTPAVHFRDPKQSNLSALHIASAGGHNALVELLLLNGADIDQLGGGDGGSALHLAVLTKHLDTCTLLITKGAKVGLLDAQGRTAVDLAMEQAKPSAAGAAPDPQASIIFGMLRLAKAAEDDARRNREAELAQREGYTAATGTGTGAGEPEAPPPIPTTAPPATPQQKGQAAAAGAAATPVPHTPGEEIRLRLLCCSARPNGTRIFLLRLAVRT
jgi:uncharacterized membrane protein YgcG